MSTVSTADRAVGSWRAPGRLPVHAAITAAVLTCYILGRVVDGPTATFLAAIGASACGWSWLLARALFDPRERDAWWPRVAVLVVTVTGALSTLISGDGLVARVAGNAYTLVGSAALMLTFVEPFNRYRRDLPAAERRYRFTFVLVYGALVGVSVLDFRIWDAAAEADRIDLIKGICALIGLVAGMAAVGFRLRHPLAVEGGPAVRRAPTPDDARLAGRLLELLREEKIHLSPDLRIGDLAARLGQPEYRISQSISALGFRNFNRLINHHRIEHARRVLADPHDSRSILEIAFECGFASLGPFNRAFKDEIGATPRAFRRSGKPS